MFKSAADFIGLRRLRSGRLFSQYYVVPDASFDLDALVRAAVEDEHDEEEIHTMADNDAPNDWEDDDDAPDATPPSPHLPQGGAPDNDASDSELSSLSSVPPSPPPACHTSPIDPTSSPPTQGGRKRRRKNHGHKMRAKKRQAMPASHENLQRHARHVAGSSARRVAFNLRKAPVTATGFRGRYEDATNRTYTREQLVREHGFVYFPWDGREVTPLVTPQRQDVGDGNAKSPSPSEGTAPPSPAHQDIVIGVLAGRPSNGEGSGHSGQAPYGTATDHLGDAIEGQRLRATFSKDAREHRRGRFGAQAYGISHGGGQLRPANLKHSARMTLVLMYLVSLPAMVRVAHFASSVFATWAPEVHEYYATTLTALLQSDPSLARNFAASVWACITINFGPRTVTFPHRDYGNLPFGWCAITALGHFDPDKGGELVLWDCKMVIRFPPGSTIIIPSAILRHSNTRIGRGERRYSVTQYTAGSIFRWVEHGFQLDEAYYDSLSAKEKMDDAHYAAGRWRRGSAMFAKLSDLVNAAERKLAA
ncbi:hypothetical protein HDZ31DRAFT_67989 [Schizophyllum fasciatum]